TIAPMKPSAAFPRLSIVSKCSPTSTSDWCRNSRGLHSHYAKQDVAGILAKRYDVTPTTIRRKLNAAT
ncbi:hypothetical protein ABE607_17875, partial [Comamonas aquatica]|uniref:hypothetical protein n=1 Tax=Comamonas aquatica TaxID=225991 RepID=UPI00320B65D7